MRKTVVINVVGLTPSLLGEHTPQLCRLAAPADRATIAPVLPAVTCPVQATYLTGKLPDRHGIVANGWYHRDTAEVRFWLQSHHLVQAESVWDMARRRDASFTCANLFWWFNMYSSVDYAVTPRPMYLADGRKLPDIYTKPANLRDRLQAELGPFPLFNFWGPATSIAASEWIASAARWIDHHQDPTLTLIYLPHLDYDLQRYGIGGPAAARALGEIDRVCGGLIDYYRDRDARIILLSEYGIQNVARPIAINRVLRDHGFLAVREELGRELLDPGASRAFAVADHQIAHVYVNARTQTDAVKALLEQTDGVATVLAADGLVARHLNHPRSGELVALAHPNRWFSYPYWMDDARAPDFARTVDIHRKPGYDPAELFLDPALRAPKLTIAAALLRRRLGFRTLLNVTPLDATLVRGSHGVPPAHPADGAMLATTQPDRLDQAVLDPTSIADLILRHLF